MEGLANSKPQIKNLKFPKGKIEIFLEDGRKIMTPVSLFPSISKLSLSQRRKWQILDGIGFTFNDSDEGFHISQFLGADNRIYH